MDRFTNLVHEGGVSSANLIQMYIDFVACLVSEPKVNYGEKLFSGALRMISNHFLFNIIHVFVAFLYE